MRKQKEGIGGFSRILKPVTEIAVNGATKLVVSQKVVPKKPKPEVIVISSDEEDGSESVCQTKSRGSTTSRKNLKAFTSILTARSKAACGLTNNPKDPIVNIDAADVDNELAIVEYVDDIYNFYKLTEVGVMTFFLSSVLDNLTSTIVMVSLLQKLVP